MDELRQTLYYPLGLLPAVFFTLRILIQWYQSEKRKRSFAGAAFWRLSLAGNILLCLHYIIQVQYPFALLQAGNAAISFRNLDLLKVTRKYNTFRAALLFVSSLLLITFIFILQSRFLVGEIDWIRTPVKLSDPMRQYHNIFWHLLGSTGALLFASRFWLQWWRAEKMQQSELGTGFWWASIGGSLLSLVYFVHIGDTVSVIYNSFGLIPYARNLILIKNEKMA